jgi:hypothetical protein
MASNEQQTMIARRAIGEFAKNRFSIRNFFRIILTVVPPFE